MTDEGWKPVGIMRNFAYDLDAATALVEETAEGMGWEVKPGSIKVEPAEPMLNPDGTVNHTRSRITYEGRPL